MKASSWLVVLAVLAFVIFVIARLPASWVIPSSSNEISCGDVSGTVWKGACAGLTTRGQAIGDLIWELHPLRLLAGKINATIALTRPTGNVQGDLEVGLDRNITAHNLVADVPLDHTLLPQIPPDLHGSVHAQLAVLKVSGRQIKVIQGHLEARNLQEGAGTSVEPFGSYSLVFPATDGDPVGELRDLGGPLEVQGTLHLTPEPGFALQALVKARPDASPDLQRAIQYLGSPDAQGRRPFGTEGTF
jgi:general secretion pathway protein N